MDAEEDSDLVEWDYGDFEGLTREQIHQKSAVWNLFVDGAPNGESPEQVGNRADRFLEKVREYKGNVAVFSHGHFLRVLAARFLGLEPELGDVFLTSVASVSILDFDRGQPVVVLWNDTHHLLS
jgi:probable phosphoglycerate mutase